MNRVMSQIGTTTMAPSSSYSSTHSKAPKPEIVDVAQKLVDAVEEVAQVDPERLEHDPDRDRDQRQPDDDAERASAEKSATVHERRLPLSARAPGSLRRHSRITCG